MCVVLQEAQAGEGGGGRRCAARECVSTRWGESRPVAASVTGGQAGEEVDLARVITN